LIFGGRDNVTGMKLDNVFEKSFSHEKNLSVWRRCGTVPLTRSPLQLQCVRNQVSEGSAHKKEELLLRELQRWNHYYSDFLVSNGYTREQLKACVPVRKTTPAITVPNTKERVKAIQKAKTSGQMFFATGGQHLNAEDFFRAKALASRHAEAASLEKVKLERLDKIKTDKEAKSLLEEKALDLTLENEKRFVMPEIKLLCKWKNCKLPAVKNKEHLVAAHLKMPRPPTPEPWTPEDDARLAALKAEDVDLKDTALGVAAKQMAAAVSQNTEKLDEETRHELLQSLAKYDSSSNEARRANPDHTREPI